MSVIGNIAGVPLFSTVQEALAWAVANGLSGFHTHSLQGQVGYMGGANHQQATGMPLNTNAPPPPIPPPTVPSAPFIPPPPPPPAPPPPPTTTIRTSGFSGGGSTGGGGGGY